jgi:hypothetical protein
VGSVCCSANQDELLWMAEDALRHWQNRGPGRHKIADNTGTLINSGSFAVALCSGVVPEVVAVFLFAIGLFDLARTK